jgi:hypothetical protein
MAEQSILKVRGIERLSVWQLQLFIACAHGLGFDPDWLACVVSFETAGSFSPAQRNRWAELDAKKKGKPFFGAVGLIQFMPATCASLLGFDPKVRAHCELAMHRFEAMTFEEQLPYVGEYFAPYKTRIESLDACYLGVFMPSAVGRANDYVLGRRDAEGFIGRVYEQNFGFDKNDDGNVTVGEICATIRAVRDAAGGRRLIVASQTSVRTDTPVILDAAGDDVADDATRINAENVLASVFETSSRMMGELLSRDMVRRDPDLAVMVADTEPPPDDDSKA